MTKSDQISNIQMTTLEVSELPQYDKNTTLPHLAPQGPSVTVTAKKKNKKLKNLKTVN